MVADVITVNGIKMYKKDTEKIAEFKSTGNQKMLDFWKMTIRANHGNNVIDFDENWKKLVESL